MIIDKVHSDVAHAIGLHDVKRVHRQLQMLISNP